MTARAGGKALPLNMPQSGIAGGIVENTALSSLDYLLAVDDVARVRALRFCDGEGRY
jgi:hypothetical protein